MKKLLRFLTVIVALVIAAVFCGCAAEAGSFDNAALPENAGQSSFVGDSSRKIVYIYSCNMTVDSVNDTVRVINEALDGLSDAYVQESNIADSNAYLQLRVKTEDYDQLIEAINLTGDVVSAQSTAQDVTNNYLSLEAKKTSAENKLKRLNELYALANIYDMVNISSQIQAAEQELFEITAQIQAYDSLISLCTVNVYISLRGASSGFSASIRGAIAWVWRGVLNVFLILVLIFPFAAVATGVGFGAYFTRAHVIKKAANKRNRQKTIDDK